MGQKNIATANHEQEELWYGMVLVDDCTILQQTADEQDDCKPLPMCHTVLRELRSFFVSYFFYIYKKGIAQYLATEQSGSTKCKSVTFVSVLFLVICFGFCVKSSDS